MDANQYDHDYEEGTEPIYKFEIGSINHLLAFPRHSLDIYFYSCISQWTHLKPTL
jgi:hypothetical protein